MPGTTSRPSTRSVENAAKPTRRLPPTGRFWYCHPGHPVKVPFSTHILAILGVIGTLCLPAARATSVIAPSFDDLVTKADCILTGDVTGLRSEWSGDGIERHIVSFVTFSVVRVLKGEAASPFTLRTLGGTVGTETVAVADAPVFRVGEREILFVHQMATGSRFTS